MPRPGENHTRPVASARWLSFPPRSLGPTDDSKLWAVFHLRRLLKLLFCQAFLLVVFMPDFQRDFNLRLMDEISSETYSAKSTKLRDREAKLRLEVEACSRGRAENADIAVKAFELSQNLAATWFKADAAAKRQIFEIVCLNCRLVDVTLVPTIRKPFDVLAEGLILRSSRGDWI